MFTTVIFSCFAHASMQFWHLCLDPFRILPPQSLRSERQLRPIAEICIIRMGFSSPPSLFGNICGGIYSRSELRRRSGGASYTKIGGRFGCLPCGAFSDTLIQGGTSQLSTLKCVFNICLIYFSTLKQSISHNSSSAQLEKHENDVLQPFSGIHRYFT